MRKFKLGDKVLLDPKVYGSYDIEGNTGTIAAVVDLDEEYGHLFEITFERPLSDQYDRALIYECELLEA